MSAVSTQMKDLMLLVESKSQSSPRVLLEGYLSESRIRLIEEAVEEANRFNKLLQEFEIKQDQVDDIFKRIAQGAKDGFNTPSGQSDTSSNRTMLGKVADVGKSMYGIWEKFKQAIADTSGVRAFDAAYNSLMKKVNIKETSPLGKMLKWYRDFAKNHPNLQQLLIVAITVLGTMATGGLIPTPAVSFVVRFVDQLIAGDRLSSAAYKAGKAALLAHLFAGAYSIGSDPASVGKATDAIENTMTWVKSLFPGDVAQAAATGKAQALSGASDSAASSIAQAAASAKGSAVGGLDLSNAPQSGTIPGGTTMPDLTQVGASAKGSAASGLDLSNAPQSGTIPGGTTMPDLTQVGASAKGSAASGLDLSNAPQSGTIPGGTTMPDLAQVGASGELPNASGPIQYTVPEKANLSKIADQFGISVKELQAANPNIDPKMLDAANPNNVLAGQKLIIPQATGAPVYAGGVGTDAVTKAAQAAGKMGANIGAVKESIDYDRIKQNWKVQAQLNLPQVSALYLTNEGVHRVFRKIDQYVHSPVNEWKIPDLGFSDNLANKITYSYLDTWWNRNYGDNVTKGSVDSKELIDFLRRRGVKDPLISKVFTELGFSTEGLVSPDTMYPKPPEEATPGPEERRPDDRDIDRRRSDDRDIDRRRPDDRDIDRRRSDDRDIDRRRESLPSSDLLPYQQVLQLLAKVKSAKGKKEIRQWIKNNWAKSSPTPAPKPEPSKDRAPVLGPKELSASTTMDYNTGEYDDWKTSTLPKRNNMKMKRFNPTSPPTLTAKTSYQMETRTITKESKSRPVWLGRR